MKEKVCPQCKTTNPMAANFCRRCRFEFPEASKGGQSLTPLIKSFRIRETSYTVGSTIHLEWEVENATEVTLDGEVATGSTEAEMVVEKSVRLVLSAKNAYNEAIRELWITPSPMPTIGFYHASAESILVGQQTKLEWIVRNALRTELTASDGTVVASRDDGAVLVSPGKTETYCLRGYSKADPSIFAEQTIVIKVLEPVKIVDFKADKRFAIETERVVLSWKTEHATSVEISPSVGVLKKRKSVEVYPTHTTVYRLTARNELSMDESTVTIEVRQLPKFDFGSVGDSSSVMIPTSCEVEIPPIQPQYQESLWKKILLRPLTLTEKLFTAIDSFPYKVKKLLRRTT